MKFILFFVCVIFGVHANPIADNFNLIHDDDGKLHLIEVNPVIDQEIAPVFEAERDVVFRLFTRSNPTTGQIIQNNNALSLQNSQFNPNNPTRFIIHGFINDGGSTVITDIRNAWINRGDFNVFSVDWGAGSLTINYIAAARRVTEVGPLLGRFINFVNIVTGQSLDNMYVVGHSLGAHIAGIAGKSVNTGRLNSVIGLDPALPLFSLDDVNGRISENDATYVEIIHTNGGLLGFFDPLGQADFYPNGGRSQAGCILDIAGICAHNRVVDFYAESIISSNFRATRCFSFAEIQHGVCTNSGTALMGGEPSNQGRGVNGNYILDTNSRSPFAQG